jgi:hypothetical protein
MFPYTEYTRICFHKEAAQEYSLVRRVYRNILPKEGYENIFFHKKSIRVYYSIRKE